MSLKSSKLQKKNIKSLVNNNRKNEVNKLIKRKKEVDSLIKLMYGSDIEPYENLEGSAFAINKNGLKIGKGKIMYGISEIVASTLAPLMSGQKHIVESILKKALKLGEDVLGPEHEDLSSLQKYLATCLEGQDKYAEAEFYYKQRLDILEKLYRTEKTYVEHEPPALPYVVSGTNHPFIAYAVLDLAVNNVYQSKFKDATSLYKRAMKSFEKIYGKKGGTNRYEVASSLSELAKAYTHKKKFAKAEYFCKYSLMIWNNIHYQDTPEIAQCLINLAIIQLHRDKIHKIKSLVRNALQIWKNSGLTDPKESGYLYLACLCSEKGRYDLAEFLYKRLLNIEIEFDPESYNVTSCLFNLAGLYRAQGKYHQAKKYYKKELRIWENLLGFNHSFVVDVKNYINAFYEEINYSFGT